ncbi:hypothetical protein BKK53_11255 [Rodentibacter trehalosifermentans]|nr:hypothetical protein BKK53_11255 [Rodentibacter trehalosifermentans]
MLPLAHVSFNFPIPKSEDFISHSPSLKMVTFFPPISILFPSDSSLISHLNLERSYSSQGLLAWKLYLFFA